MLLFGVYNGLSQVCQLSFIAVATILSGIRKSLDRGVLC